MSKTSLRTSANDCSNESRCFNIVFSLQKVFQTILKSPAEGRARSGSLCTCGVERREEAGNGYLASGKRQPVNRRQRGRRSARGGSHRGGRRLRKGRFSNDAASRSGGAQERRPRRSRGKIVGSSGVAGSPARGGRREPAARGPPRSAAPRARSLEPPPPSPGRPGRSGPAGSACSGARASQGLLARRTLPRRSLASRPERLPHFLGFRAGRGPRPASGAGPTRPRARCGPQASRSGCEHAEPCTPAPRRPGPAGAEGGLRPAAAANGQRASGGRRQAARPSPPGQAQLPGTRGKEAGPPSTRSGPPRPLLRHHLQPRPPARRRLRFPIDEMGEGRRVVTARGPRARARGGGRDPSAPESPSARAPPPEPPGGCGPRPAPGRPEPARYCPPDPGLSRGRTGMSAARSTRKKRDEHTLLPCSTLQDACVAPVRPGALGAPRAACSPGDQLPAARGASLRSRPRQKTPT
ncbi:uncharacterized protein [Canis lupus baileyi]|uniref:uncharacterized protein n=1 Tax=Canis lupus baileyi TaxID=143281 RepID=UPI003B971A25